MLPFERREGEAVRGVPEQVALDQDLGNRRGLVRIETCPPGTARAKRDQVRAAIDRRRQLAAHGLPRPSVRDRSSHPVCHERSAQASPRARTRTEPAG
jgi:hypothetical protein